MGTNYYLRTREKSLVRSNFNEDEYVLRDEPDFHYEIHLNKCSFGWRTLFQAHNKAYNSVAGLKKFLKDHADSIEIFNEYDEKLSLPEYFEEVLERDARNLEHPEKCGYGEGSFGFGIIKVDDNYTGPVILTPFDHLEYFKFEHDRHPNHYVPTPNEYWNDPEGFNFCETDFS